MVWLASYPKSGNTWFRTFLAALTSDDPLDINALQGGMASARDRFDALVGLEAADLTPAEIERLRPRVYDRLASLAEETPRIKIHDALLGPCTGQPIVPVEATRGAIYLLRNPLDVALSLAAHAAEPVDRTIEKMGDPGFAFSGRPDRLAFQLPQHLGTWSEHVLGWLAAPFPVHVVTYESMHARPVDVFSAAARFAGLDVEETTVAAALARCRFERLQAQERDHGFRERPRQAERFFRRGEAGAWRDELTPAQVARLVADHGEVMRRFGYLDANGRPVVGFQS